MSFNKIFFYPVLVLYGCILLVTNFCTPPDNNIAEVIQDEQEANNGDNNDKEPNSGSNNSTCDSKDTYSDSISIRDLEFVDSNNVAEYLLKGTCKNNNKLVQIKVNGYKISHVPECDKSRWEVTLNLISIANKSDTIIFELTHNQETICEEVKIAFIGPENYIPVPPLDGYYESGFYVMKYEAKHDKKARTAISIHNQNPMSASYQDAVNLCRNNGSRYSLITNKQWQNIARAIEPMDQNWSTGQAAPSDNNTLNCGVRIGSPQSASSDDAKDCANSSCDDGWDYDRRTHSLLNEQKIWDICGNVGEIMKDKYRQSETFNDYAYNLSSILKKTFGPKKSYNLINANRRSNTFGLGHVKIERKKDLIVRGKPGRDAGIFSVDITSDQDARRRKSGIGFRCIYLP